LIKSPLGRPCTSIATRLPLLAIVRLAGNARGARQIEAGFLRCNRSPQGRECLAHRAAALPFREDIMKGKKQSGNSNAHKMKRKAYEKELRKLHVELCHLQQWVKFKGLRAMIVFEGRDAAGKGGTIKAITERVSPRVFRVVALPAPSDREKTQLFMQRYIAHFPAAGEIVIFDRSWYNRAGVEYVMGFCTEAAHKRFLDLCPQFEQYIVDAGITLIKVWLEVGQAEQERRFAARIDDPLRQWKLSPMDIESYAHWQDYSRARDLMLEATDSKHAPWHIVRSDDKRRARLNGISHILSRISYKKAPREKVELPDRLGKGKYDDQAGLKGRKFVAERY
jgi:polyphosphate kinase 2